MDTTEIAFNRHVGVRRADREGFLLMLVDEQRYLNHIGTVHAAALFALAEATGGEFLSRRFADLADAVIPVVRRAEAKYASPGRGRLYSKAAIPEGEAERVIDEIAKKGRTILGVAVEIVDEEGKVVMKASFEWFVKKQGGDS
jgi:acyl-coenzyme A thioesterase PaaI-like protein